MPELLKDRIIEQGPDGQFYSINAVTLVYEDYDGQNVYFLCPPESLYNIILQNIRRMAQLDTEEVPGASEEMNMLKKQLSRGVRAAVKGVLVMWGDKLLTLFYGTKEHPHVPKKYDPKQFDLTDWYMCEFTKVFIANMMRKDLVLVGRRTRTTNGQTYISVDEVATRPIPGTAQIVSTTDDKSGTGQ